MNILFISPPPHLPNRLHRNRAFDLIKILSQKHSVHLLAVTTEKTISSEFTEIKKFCASTFTIKLSKFQAIFNCIQIPFLPSEVGYCHSKEVQKKIQELIKTKKIDIIYAKRLRSAIYLENTTIPVLLDSTDAMSLLYKRLLQSGHWIKKPFYFLEWIRYKWFEKKIAKKPYQWIVCSDLDKKYLKFVKNIAVIPNGVDTDYFKPLQVKLIKNLLLFRGLMDKPVNIDACNYFIDTIFPLVKKEIPNSKLFVVGANPEASIKSKESDSIKITGYVQDIRTYIQQSHIVVCPVRIGTGTRFKILQAWAMGKPVVSTSIGAEGLEYRNEENIEIADNPVDFDQKIVMLLKDKKQYNKLAKNGRKTVEKFYSLSAVEVQLNQILENVIKKSNKNPQ